MRKHLLTLLAGLLVLAGATGCGGRFDPSNFVPKGSGLPNFSVIMNNGESVNLLSLMGTPAVIVTFGNDAVSGKALALLQSLYDDYRYKVRFIAISSSMDEFDVESYWGAHNLSMPYSAQDDNKQAKKFHDSVPYMVVINDNFEKMASYDGGSLPNRAELENVFAKALR